MTIDAKFYILSRGETIGWSKFEHRDPPMGVALGAFIAAPAYSKIRELVRATLHSGNRVASQSELQLLVRAPWGELFDARGCISICDGATVLQPDDMEIEILGFGEFSRYFGTSDDA